jgi:hypothetical protein
MTIHLDPRMKHSMISNRLLLQKYSLNANVADIRFVIKGSEKQILAVTVGGGFRLWMEWEDVYVKASLSVYYHRLCVHKRYDSQNGSNRTV